MKRLLLVLLLVLVLTFTFATPVFADDGKGNMPGNAWEENAWCGLSRALMGTVTGMVNSGGNAVFNAYGAVYRLWSVIYGQPPAKPFWASGPK